MQFVGRQSVGNYMPNLITVCPNLKLVYQWCQAQLCLSVQFDEEGDKEQEAYYRFVQQHVSPVWSLIGKN